MKEVSELKRHVYPLRDDALLNVTSLISALFW